MMNRNLSNCWRVFKKFKYCKYLSGTCSSEDSTHNKSDLFDYHILFWVPSLKRNEKF